LYWRDGCRHFHDSAVNDRCFSQWDDSNVHRRCAVRTTRERCRAPTELKLNALKGEVASVAEDKCEPEAGTTLIEIALANNGAETCPATIKGTKKVTGPQKCTNSEPEVFAVEKEIGCLESGSNLKLGESTADLKMAITIHLTNGPENVKVATA
jgi:hypothetical protein